MGFEPAELTVLFFGRRLADAHFRLVSRLNEAADTKQPQHQTNKTNNKLTTDPTGSPSEEHTQQVM